MLQFCYFIYLLIICCIFEQQSKTQYTIYNYMKEAVV